MVSFELQSDLEKLTEKLAIAGPRQLPFITARALNKIAERTIPVVQNAMRNVFDQPTDWTINSIYVKGATKSDLTASIQWKNPSSDISAGEYLKPEVFGGSRPAKRFEVALQARGLIPANWRAVPTDHAPLDSYGNVSGSYVRAVLSSLGTDKFKRSKGQAARTKFFAVMPGGQLSPGIYEQLQSGFGLAIRKIFNYVSSTRYHQTFDFNGVAEQYATSIAQDELNNAIDYAISTSRDPLGT